MSVSDAAVQITVINRNHNSSAELQDLSAARKQLAEDQHKLDLVVRFAYVEYGVTFVIDVVAATYLLSRHVVVDAFSGTAA